MRLPPDCCGIEICALPARRKILGRCARRHAPREILNFMPSRAVKFNPSVAQ